MNFRNFVSHLESDDDRVRGGFQPDGGRALLHRLYRVVDLVQTALKIEIFEHFET